MGIVCFGLDFLSIKKSIIGLKSALKKSSNQKVDCFSIKEGSIVFSPHDF